MVRDQATVDHNGSMLRGEPAILSVMCVDAAGLAGEHDAEPAITMFSRASDALRAAVELRHVDQPPDRSPARVAIDTGELDPDGSTTSVEHRALRLLRAGHPGQILASSTTIEIARRSLDTVALLDLGTHHLRGVETPMWIWQVGSTDGSSSFPPLRTREAAAALLPVPATSFIGRDDDLVALADLIDQHRLVTIVGSGGCGKTRLAVEVALDVLGRFRHGVAWVDLAAVTDPTSVIVVVAAAVGFRSTNDVTPDLVVGHIGGGSRLLLVDNCEHVVDEAAGVIAAIVTGCPAVRVLATSREPLALLDEVVWRIPSLQVPNDSDAETEAVRLLVDRIRTIRPGYEPDGADRVAITTICRRLDGIPLALELAAAHASTMSVIELAAQLEERFALLAGGARDAVARQRTLEASVAWSYHLLDHDEQRAFRRLSAFTGSFSSDAAHRLCDHVREPDRVLTRLRNCSLIVERVGPGARMVMLEPVRWFARERLIDSGEADVVLGHHLDLCLDTARTRGSQLETSSVHEALAELDADADNLRAAMEWAVGNDRGLDAARIIAATSWYWVWRGRIGETERWLQRAGIDDASLDPSDRLAILWARCELIGNRAGRIDDLVADGLEIARRQQDRRTEARLLVSHSRYRAFSDPHETIAQAPAERALCRDVGDQFWASMSYVGEALAQISLGRFDLAEPLLDELRHQARSLGHPQLVADEIARRATVDRRFGRYGAVRAAVTDIDRITSGITTLNSQALVHAQAALVDVAQGRAEEALEAMRPLFRRYLDAGELGYLPSIALPMIDALIDLGRADEALERFDQLWTSFRKTISWRLRLGSVRATALLADGQIDAAATAFADVLDVAHEAGNDHEVAIAERYLAVIDRAAQRCNDAEARLHRSLEIQARLGYPQYVADDLEELAGIDLEHRRPTQAAVLLGAGSTIRAASGVTRRVGRQAAYEVDLATVRESLGDHFDEHWDRGARLTMEDAVHFARRGRGERRRPSAGWDSLTVTERKVADLAADGLTNPEIAATLVMGRATVKTHVSNVLRKLGLTNRTQLAGLAARRRP